MAGFGPADYIALQLREIAPDGEWNAAGVDRAAELAAMFVRAGVKDLTDLQLLRVKVTSTPAETWLPPETSDAFALSINGRTFGFLGTPDRKDNNAILDGLGVAWSAAGHGNVSYQIVPGSDGFAIVPRWQSSSDWHLLHESVKFYLPVILSIVLPIAGFSIATSIGSMVLGDSLSATYPLLAKAVGQVALSTAMNNGNVESAVRGAALSFVGGQAGSVVGGAVLDATDVSAIAKASSAATAALVQGGDIKSAIGVSLLQSGATMKLGQFEDFTAIDAVALADSSATDFFSTDFSMPASYHDPVYDAPPDYSPSQVSTPADQLFPATPIQSPIPSADQIGSSTFDPIAIVQGASKAAIAALQLVSVWKAVNQPGVNTQARQVLPNGSVVAASDNGLIQTQTTDGRIVSTLPPKGSPQTTISGNIVVNNGDGTYTLIDAMGGRTVHAYASGIASSGGFSLGSLDMQTIALGAAGLIGVFALLRHR